MFRPHGQAVRILNEPSLELGRVHKHAHRFARPVPHPVLFRRDEAHRPSRRQLVFFAVAVAGHRRRFPGLPPGPQSPPPKRPGGDRGCNSDAVQAARTRASEGVCCGHVPARPRPRLRVHCIYPFHVKNNVVYPEGVGVRVTKNEARVDMILGERSLLSEGEQENGAVLLQPRSALLGDNVHQTCTRL